MPYNEMDLKEDALQEKVKKDKTLYFGFSTIALILGLVVTLFLLNDAMDRKEAKVKQEVLLAAMPANPVEKAEFFMENIKNLPATDVDKELEHREKFFEMAAFMLEDGKLDTFEYNWIKDAHHQLQEEAVENKPAVLILPPLDAATQPETE